MKVETRGLLVGMTLGDAYVGYRQRGPKYHESWIKIKHSIDQVDFCAHKLDLVQKSLHAGFKAKLGFYDAKLHGKTYRQCQFQVSHPYFQQIREWAYPNGKFTVSRRLLDMLTPQGIAIWYMDDGSARVNINKDGIVSSCSTDIAMCKSEVEARIACDYFMDEYKIKFSPYKVNSKSLDSAWCIRTNTEGSHEFAGIIFPYVIPSMLYKLKHVADLKTHECRAPVGACNACGCILYDNRRRGKCGRCYEVLLKSERKI